MRNYLLIFFSLTILGCNAQSNKTIKNKATMDLSFINNEKIKYAIVLMSCDTCAPIRNIGYRVIVELNKDELSKIKKINKEDWLKLLNSDTSDFSANLILYSIYNKDAFLLLRNDNKEQWRKYMKSEDLNYWKSHLK